MAITKNNAAPLRVAFLSEIPTPYRLPVFRRLTQELAIQCRFLFCAEAQSDRQWVITDLNTIEQQILPGWHFHRKDRQAKNTYTTYFNPAVWRALVGFDLVVIGGWAQPTMIIAILACLWRGIPYIINSESHGHKPRSRFKRWFKQFFPGSLIRRASGFLVTGSYARDYVLSFGYPADKIATFPNTIDVAHYLVESARLQRKKSLLREELRLPAQYNVLFVGRLITAKGVDKLIEAFDRIAEVSNDWGLVLIGDGPLRNALASTIRHKSWRQRALLIPYIRSEDLLRYYVASDLFVLPSLDEPWGVVVNEAMACGLPLILTPQVGAAGDLLKEGINGLLCAPNSIDDLAKKLLDLMSQDRRRQAMAEASLQIISDWGYEKNIQGFRSLLSKLTGDIRYAA